MRIRFQADADLKHAIIAGALRRVATLDFRLVSHDVNTMEHHFRLFIQRKRSPGLILIPQKRMTVRQAIDGLVLIWEVVDAADLENRVCLFPSLAIF